VKMFDTDKTRMIGLPYGEKHYDNMLNRFHLIPERHGRTDEQIDGRTDRQTDRIAISISPVSVLTRDKNGLIRINDMTVNFTKTKEMVMGPAALSSNLPLIQWAEGQIERISRPTLKLLGLHLDLDISWHPTLRQSLTKRRSVCIF